MAANRELIKDAIIDAMLTNMGSAAVSDEQLVAIERTAEAIAYPVADEIDANSSSGGGIMWRGSYNSGTLYLVNDAVFYPITGSSYVCIAPTTGHAPTNDTYWSLFAQAGDDGADGAAGAAGADGTNGKSVRNGTGAPDSSIGVNGDFYIDKAAWMIFGPKASGDWPAGVYIVPPRWVRTTDTAALTGNITNTLLHFEEILADTFGPGNMIRMLMRIRRTAASSNSTIRMYVNSTPSLSGALLLGTYIVASSNLYGQIERHMLIKSATVSELFPTSVISHTDVGVSASAVSTVNPGWNATRYIIFAGQNGVNGDSLVLSGSIIERL